MKKALMIVAIIAMIVITGSMVYYFVFFKPKIEKAWMGIQEEKLKVEKENATTNLLEYLRKSK